MAHDEMVDDEVRIVRADALDGDSVLIDLSDRTTLKISLTELLSLDPERIADVDEE